MNTMTPEVRDAKAHAAIDRIMLADGFEPPHTPRAAPARKSYRRLIDAHAHFSRCVDRVRETDQAGEVEDWTGPNRESLRRDARAAEADFDEARADLMDSLAEAAGNADSTAADGRVRACAFLLPCGLIVGLAGDITDAVSGAPVFSLDPRKIVRVVA